MSKRVAWFSAGLIVFLAALAYVPHILHIGYAFDDWYLMWAAKAEGPGVFHAIFAEDRPLRAFLLGPAYRLFGERAQWYNLSALVIRIVGGVAFWWLLGMLWPRLKREAVAMAALFVLYPGFLSQLNGIDYQSQIVALALAMVSLGLTIHAYVNPMRSWMRVSWLLLSGLCGLAYLGLVDYFIGFEVVRVALLFMLVRRETPAWKERIWQTSLRWAPLTLIPLGFVFWRAFLFEGGRKATNPLSQLSVLVFDPFRTLLKWLLTWLGDIFDVLVRAWFVPLRQAFPYLDGTGMAVGAGLALLSALLIGFSLERIGDHGWGEEEREWRWEALYLGLFSLAVCLAPVILANREVSFPDYSRYALASAAGVAMVLVALLSLLPKKIWGIAGVASLVFLATLTHFANSARAAQYSEAMNDFWWQVAWRAPGLERGTTIIAQYPVAPLQEDYFVWGPANLIYFPIGMNDRYIEPAIFAALPTEETVQNVLNSEPQDYDRRKNIVTYANYRNTLLMLKPTADSCVRIVGDEFVDLSSQDAEMFRQIAPFSEVDQITIDTASPDVPVVVFGPEPEHGWCYYYQQASLARQRGDWRSVVELSQEVGERGLVPTDPVEWLPFLQGEAVVGDVQAAVEIGGRITDEFVLSEFCASLSSLEGLSVEDYTTISSALCVASAP